MLAPFIDLMNSNSFIYNTKGGNRDYLFFTDDLNVFTKDDDQQKYLLNIVKIFNHVIKREIKIINALKLL